MAGETMTIKTTIRFGEAVSVNTGSNTMAGGGVSESDSQVVYSSGQKATQKVKCAGWSAAPGSGFTDEGVCEFSEGANDKGTVQFSCIGDAKTRAADCWGAVRGVAGRFAGKTGNITWHQVNSADQKTGTANGVGFWND